MKKNWIVFVSMLVLALGFNACSMGEYNDLECDPADYPAECQTANSYTYCKAGQVISVICGGDRVCHAGGSSVACQGPAAAPEPADADTRDEAVTESVVIRENVD